MKNMYWNKLIPELSVSNLENSLNFYKIAGFKLEYDRPENKFAFISLGELQFMLQEIIPNDKWNIAPLNYPFGNGINFQLEVDDLDVIYNSFKKSNYKITFDIEENWYRQDDKLLGNKEFLIQDPDGYLLRFFEDLGEKMNIELRKFKLEDIEKIRYFYTECTEWKNWDGPWEDWSYDEEYELTKRLEKTKHEPCFEYEIIFNGEHIGWVAAYYMTDDFKYNKLNKTDKIAIGINIPDTKHRGLGIGKKVYKKYLNYFKSLGYTEIYTQTWSGNIPMVNLALSSGFKEINRYKDIRVVNGKTYDALTFRIEL